MYACVFLNKGDYDHLVLPYNWNNRFWRMELLFIWVSCWTVLAHHSLLSCDDLLTQPFPFLNCACAEVAVTMCLLLSSCMLRTCVQWRWQFQSSKQKHNKSGRANRLNHIYWMFLNPSTYTFTSAFHMSIVVKEKRRNKKYISLFISLPSMTTSSASIHKYRHFCPFDRRLLHRASLSGISTCKTLSPCRPVSHLFR